MKTWWQHLVERIGNWLAGPIYDETHPGTLSNLDNWDGRFSRIVENYGDTADLDSDPWHHASWTVEIETADYVWDDEDDALAADYPE